jgi:hypothetical protein
MGAPLQISWSRATFLALGRHSIPLEGQELSRLRNRGSQLAYQGVASAESRTSIEWFRLLLGAREFHATSNALLPSFDYLLFEPVSLTSTAAWVSRTSGQGVVQI